jgi:uncharacterized protein (TIGR00661 family)
VIFVTTGTQEPFDRLIKAVDEIAYNLAGVTFVVQAFTDDYQAKNFKIAQFISPAEFQQHIINAELIISHAGMGSIISALTNSKPIIVMPRLLKFHEHRNEHQLATAKKLDTLGYIHVAYDEQELIKKVLSIWPDKLECLHNIGDVASSSLIDSLNKFIQQ